MPATKSWFQHLQDEVQNPERKFGGKFKLPAFPSSGCRRRSQKIPERLSDSPDPAQHLNLPDLQPGIFEPRSDIQVQQKRFNKEIYRQPSLCLCLSHIQNSVAVNRQQNYEPDSLSRVSTSTFYTLLLNMLIILKITVLKSLGIQSAVAMCKLNLTYGVWRH